MASSGGPDFEPAFGSRATDEPLEPRLRDRHGFPSVQHPDADDGHAGGSVSELVDSVGSHRTVGEGPNERVVAGEPMSIAATPVRKPAEDPVIPTEMRDTTPSNGTRNPARVGTRWSRVRRRLMATCGLAIVIALLYFLVSLLQVWTTGRTDDDGPVDAIVVMGAAQYDGRPSPQLAARLDHVVKIWPDAVAPFVVVTGGNIPGDRFTEAEASADYLIERGVPAEAILLENSGSNSQDSLTSVSNMLSERGLDEVLIVTDPYHALRSRLIAEEVGLDTQVSSTDTSVVTGFDSLEKHVQEAGGVAVGRIIGFQRLSELVD